MDTEYDMPWRPNFEARAAAGWAVSIAVGLLLQVTSQLPLEPFLWLTGVCGIMIVWRGGQALRIWRRKARLAGHKIEFVTHAELDRKAGKNRDELYLGQGFEWGPAETQRLADILARDPKQIGLPDGRGKPGVPWIHGLGVTEKPIRVPLGLFEGHLGIFGTTGAGKTRLFDLLIIQAIRRDESVIILDPKCDKELMANARRACAALDKSDRFVVFHPARPGESARINPLRNWNRPTEVATRIASLIPSETGADPFKAFGQNALNNVINGLLMVHKVPTLINIRSYLEGGVDDLAVKTVEAYGMRHIDDFRMDVERYLKVRRGSETPEGKRKALTEYYRQVIKPIAPSPDLEGLLSMAEHNREHLSKMIASLIPILGMLTSGHMGPLLSPDEDDFVDVRPIHDLRSLIDSQMVLYIALDSLSDAMVGSAIGSMVLSDLTAVAGDRYNFGERLRPVNIFVDEAAEVINTGPFVQMLNKGRGAGFRVTVASQTLPDFIVRTGSEDAAHQVLGNINNWICLRVLDTKTQENFSERLPKTKVKYVMRTQGGSMGDSITMYGGNAGERLMEEEAELFPAAMLGRLPNLEFVASFAGGKFVKGRLPILIADQEKK